MVLPALVRSNPENDMYFGYCFLHYFANHVHFVYNKTTILSQFVYNFVSFSPRCRHAVALLDLFRNVVSAVLGTVTLNVDMTGRC